MGGFTKFFVYIALLITSLGLISMIFDLHRYAFYGEMIILFILFVVAILFSLTINSNMRWGWILSTVFFAIAFIDMLFVYVIRVSEIEFFMPLIVAALAGFFISLFSIGKPAVQAAEVKKTFKPGKYIASKAGTRFHTPKCDWAKKVKKKNELWFDSKEEAEKAGYKADSCLKQ
jgi:hypothetical protein